MVNVNKLRGKMVEKGISTEGLSKSLGINKATLYRKFKAQTYGFTISDASKISKALNLNATELSEIFFEQ